MPLSSRNFSINDCFRLFVFKLALLMLLGVPNWAAANEAQLHILNAGVNLGWAVARYELLGDRDPANEALVLEHVADAAAHIDFARTIFRLPYREDRRVEGIDQRIIDKANNYPQRMPSLTLAQKISYIKQLRSSYRLSFQTTFMDRPRSDFERTGYHYYPNCDFSTLDFGYHFGRAQIASNVGGNEARGYQNGANGSFRSAVQSGLSVALDGYPYGPQTNVRKACCFFGTPIEWGRMPDFQHNSPPELYAAYLATIQNQIENTVMPPGTCGGVPRDRAYEECARKYPGSEPDGTNEHGQVICKCPEGFTWNATRTACEKLLPPNVLCARDYANSIAAGRASDGSVNCACPEGYTWNSARTACEKLIPPDQLCARDYPNSIADGRAPDGTVNCKCSNGYTWNSARTACEKLIPPNQLCARDYPNSIADGRAPDGTVNCKCPNGYTWNSTRTACETLIPPDQLCARDYPNSIASGRAPDGSVNCYCPQGYKWTTGNTACVQVIDNTAECNRIIGHWRWFTERDVEFTANNRWLTHDGFTGSWKCNRDGSVDVIPDRGVWVDTVRVNQDGSGLSGRNQQGVRVTATRKGGAGRRQDCPPGYNPYGCL